MDFSIGNNFPDFSNIINDKIENKLKGVDKKASDDKLMEACKSFETYLVEQIMTKMEETAHIDGVQTEDDNEYSIFKDIFREDKAEMLTKNVDFGIAKMLYESLKTSLGNKNVLQSDKISPARSDL